MSIAKPFTFVAGQKARANEVNADFDTLYSQVNINIADIAQINRDVDNIESTKADINGNSTQRFAVANPVNSTDAVNKQTLNKSLTNVLDFINGLTIEKDTGSPNDTILINPGSCYDSTKQIVLELTNITSKKNEGQGASATYYVYIIGNETGSSIDIIISNSSVEPTLPTGYTKFRNIGRFTTDSSKNIDKIFNYSNTFVLSSLDIIKLGMPNYSRTITYSSSGNYTAPYDCLFIVYRYGPGDSSRFTVKYGSITLTDNGTGEFPGKGDRIFLPMLRGQTYNISKVGTWVCQIVPLYGG